MPRRRTPFSPNDLLVFAAIAREKSIRGAATSLGIPKSTVSRQLAELEAAAGASLVTRSTRRFVLTDLGQAVAIKAQELATLMGSALDVVENETREPTGTLRVTTSPLVGSAFMPEIVAAYLGENPRVKIEIHLSTHFVDLRRTAIDVAIRTGPLADDPDLYAARLGTSVTGHYASPAYLAARGTPSKPADLATHDCLVVGGTGRGAWTFKSDDGTVSVDVTSRLRVDSFAVARECAARGVGILRTARFYAEPYCADGRLVRVLERHWPRVTVYAVYASSRPPPKVRAFVDVVRRVMKHHLDA